MSTGEGDGKRRAVEHDAIRVSITGRGQLLVES